MVNKCLALLLVFSFMFFVNIPVHSANNTKDSKGFYKIIESVPEKEPAKKSEPKEPKDSAKYPIFAIILKTTVPISFHASSSSDLRFLESFSDGYSGGVGIGFGLYFELIPLSCFAVETGIAYRTFSLGWGAVTYSEIQIPLIVKYRYFFGDGYALYLGVGVSYFYQYSGTVNPASIGSGRYSLDLPKTDLRDGFSLIVRLLEGEFRLVDSLVFRIEFGYEWAPKRTLNISSHDLVISFGLGFHIY